VGGKMRVGNKFFLIFLILFVLSISHCLIDEGIGQTSQYTEKELREIIRANPNHAEAHYNLGILLQDLKRNEEAEKEYKEANKINPNYADAHNNLGILLQHLRRYEEAEKEYKEAIRINPNHAEAHANLGLLYKDINKKDEARREFLIARGLFEKQNRAEHVKTIDEWLNNLK